MLALVMDLQESAAWRYHQATNHSVESLRRNRHTLDWANQPRPYKRYAQPLQQVALPRELPQSSMPALQALSSSAPAAGERVPDLPLISLLLQLSAGITKVLHFPHGDMPFRAAACTGALYHIDLYVVCGELPDLPAGVYHFDVENVALTRLREGDFRGVLVEATAQHEHLGHAPATIVASSTWWRNSWKYQSRTYRHSFWDSGTILANLLALATAHDLPASLVLGFADAPVNALLDLDPAREAALELVPLGWTAAEPPPAASVLPLHVPVQAYSFHEVDYPLIYEAHKATSLSSAAEVRAWQGACHSERRAKNPQPASPPEPIESVIRRRGSAREFEQTPIGLEALEMMLAAATVPPPNDWGAPLSEPYLIVNAIDGLPSGSYRYASGALEPLRLGDYRGIAGRLDLGQDLAADAAVNVYFLADLRDIIGRLGERGYRAAQLDGSLTAGKLYLAAYALGAAATGLTFFDDEVSEFFGTDKSVMFLLAIGNKRRRR